MTYEIHTTATFDKWAANLKDRKAALAIAMRLDRAANGNLGDVKSVSDNVSEMRIFVGQGYRVYFKIRHGKVIVLLCGGDKSPQQRDIEKAKELAKKLLGAAMKTETKPYNPFNHLLTDADMGQYLTNAFMDDDPAVFVTALGHVAKAKGLAKLSQDTGLNRESLYKALSGKSKPKWDTVQRIIKALNIQIHLEPTPS